jgi:mannose/cellobiose epimerase-like protein (N-acyl-D-glucosamine 2-epimerase family)
MSPSLPALSGGLQSWLMNSALPLWQTRGVDAVHGGFVEWMGQDGEARPAAKRCYPQARQIYVFAQAGLMGWDGPWLETVEQGLDFFLRAFPRGDGLMRLRVAANGAAEDETPRLYDQAFALLALATARRVLPDRADLEAAAVALRGRLLSDRRAPKGGFIEVVGQPFYANPNMHLLEAALAWAATSNDPAWGAMADELAELALAKYIDPDGGFLREYFDATWAPSPGDDGRLVEPGHQFEWAWLVMAWSRLRGRPEGLVAAARLYEIGRMGVDRTRGVAINALWDDLSVRDAEARTWPQTEWIKAALAMARLEPSGSAKRAEFEGDAAAAVVALEKYLATPVAGLWWDRCLADGRFADEPAPATSFYHIVCAIAELRSQA